MALGIQITNTTEAKADSEVTAAASTENNQVPVTTAEPTGSEQESTDGSDSDVQAQGESTNELVASTEETSADENLQVTKPEKVITGFEQSQVTDGRIINSNRTDLEGDFPFVEIKPIKDGLANVNDPAIEGNGQLMVPYVYHGNGSVYVLDENNKPILDENDVTGYKRRSEGEIYIKMPKFRLVTAPFMDEVYGAAYYGADGENHTKKGDLIRALGREGAFYMQGRNHGYDTMEDLNKYVDDFMDLLGKINAYDDNGEPIKPVAPASHHSSSNQTLIDLISELNDKGSKNMEEVNMTVTANKKATLYTEKGDTVTNRGVQEDSTWHADKIATINGKKMYRITDTEWIADEDVK